MNHTTLTDEDFAIKANQAAELDAPSAEQDSTDYRAMLAREQYKRFQAGITIDDLPVIPREFLVKEERMREPFRAYWEEFRPSLRGSYEWLRS